MSADGKIGDARRSGLHLGSAADRAHLERQVALADGVLMGAGTLRSEGRGMGVYDAALLADRARRGQPPQPVQIVGSASGALDPDWPFFRQGFPRWLLTGEPAAARWRDRPEFDRVLAIPQGRRCANAPGDREAAPGAADPAALDWRAALAQLWQAGLKTLAVLGGGTLVGSLLEVRAIDELWLTVCPRLLGGSTAPTPADGTGLPAAASPQLELLSVETVDREVFLHYRLPAS